MSNKERIKRLDEKVQLFRIKRQCGYIVGILILILMLVFMAATIWINYQMMSQILWQQEDGLDQMMEIRNSVDSIVDDVDKPVITSAGEFEITHYCTCSICCGDYADGITATGTVATPGRTVAADPTILPYGTILLINEKEYVVEDCGGAIKGNRIDILMESHEAARKAGRYRAEVSIKKEHQLLTTADVQ